MKGTIPKEPSPLAIAIRANRERIVRNAKAIVLCGRCSTPLVGNECPYCGDNGYEPNGKVGFSIRRYRQ